MTDEVAALVLRDNYDQAQALSRSAALAASMVEVHERYIHNLEQPGLLSRELEFLPSEEVLGERKAAGGGLTTPEFAILLSYSKIALSEELLASGLPDDPYFAVELERYFPSLIQQRFAAELQQHPLRREIIVSRVVNELVNRGGTTFAFRLRDETGAAADDIVRAYTVGREVFRLPDLWHGIEALDGQVAAETQVEMMLKARILLERTTRWLLRNRRDLPDVAATISHFAPGAIVLADGLPTLLGPSARGTAEEEATQLTAAGVPVALAERVARLEALVPAFDIVEIAVAAGADVETVARIYFALGTRLELDWLRDQIVALPRDTRWEAMARASLRDDVYGEQAALTTEVLAARTDGGAPDECVEGWLLRNEDAVERSRQMLADIRTAGAPDLARLSVAVREIRSLIQASAASEPAAEPAAARASGS
jgi:glutamate dehydrogenase